MREGLLIVTIFLPSHSISRVKIYQDSEVIYVLNKRECYNLVIACKTDGQLRELILCSVNLGSSGIDWLFLNYILRFSRSVRTTLTSFRLALNDDCVYSRLLQSATIGRAGSFNQAP